MIPIYRVTSASEAQYLNVGPPVYFVIRNTSLSTPPTAYNYTDYGMQDRVCNAVSRCNDRSLEGLVSAAACTPDSYIAQPASSWMDVLHGVAVKPNVLSSSFPIRRVCWQMRRNVRRKVVSPV